MISGDAVCCFSFVLLCLHLSLCPIITLYEECRDGRALPGVVWSKCQAKLCGIRHCDFPKSFVKSGQIALTLWKMTAALTSALCGVFLFVLS